MIRLCVTATIALVWGCNDPNVLARAGGAELRVDDIASLLADARGFDADSQTVESLARRWVEYTLFARRLADGEDFLDSITVRETQWPEVRRAVVDSFRTRLAAERVTIDSAAVASAYEAGAMRVIFHVLRAVDVGAAQAVKVEQRRTAQRIRSALVAGGSWAAANAQSQDPVAKSRGGSLGIIRPGQTVTEFDRVAFALAPGAVSDVVETNFGYHVLYRPPLTDVRDEYVAALREQFERTVDSTYKTELLERLQLSVRDDVGETIRTLLPTPFRAKSSTQPLATYDGGTFTMGDLVRWLQVLPERFTLQARRADDDRMRTFVRDLVLDELMWREAVDAGIDLTTDQFRRIRAQHENQLMALWTATGLTPDSVMALGASPSARAAAVQPIVDEYLRTIVRNTTMFQPVPAFLADKLLETSSWTIERAAVRHTVRRTLALRLSRQADSIAPPPSN